MERRGFRHFPNGEVQLLFADKAADAPAKLAPAFQGNKSSVGLVQHAVGRRREKSHLLFPQHEIYPRAGEVKQVFLVIRGKAGVEFAIHISSLK
jgi:hypothetical protein